VSATHELRVLDGLHAGARAPLHGSGALRLAIGSALTNDIVLSDPGIAPEHAALHWDAEQQRWQLLPDGQPAAGPGHAVGDTLAVGPVRVTVMAANDPFDLIASPPVAPEPAAGAEAIDPSAAEQAATEAGAEAEPAPTKPGAGAEPLASPASSPSSWRDARSPLNRWVWLLGAGTVLLLAVVAAGLWMFARGAQPPAPQAQVMSPHNVADLRAAVAATLQQQGLDKRLQLQGDARQASVRGLLPDPAAAEALAAALTRLQPRPGLQVWTLEQVRGALRDGGLRLPASVSLAVDDQGRLLLAGALPTEAAERALPPAVGALLPPFITLRTAFEPPTALARRFIADARAQGFDLDGSVQGRQLVLSASVPDRELPRWERWLLGAQQRLAGLLTLQVQMRPPAATPAPAPRRLPFTVASVVSGPQPWVMLSDGSRLVPGGRRDSYTLLEINNDSLVLQGAGPIFKVPR
jgi:type III secretion protein D